MGLGGIIGGLTGSKPKGPSPAQLQAEREAAARAERDKLAKERAGEQASAQKMMQEAESKRQTLRGQLATVSEEDTTQRKRFLKGV
jgi:hypothetical protein